MRYAIMGSAVPASGLSVRLRLEGGSTVEGDRELGFMHLLEHMIFHGSANLPQGSLPIMLRHQGLRRWSDFNAFTSFDETLFRLDLVRADPRARETALVLMREIAGNLVFHRPAVEGAKQRVREEIAGRDPVDDRLTAAQNAFFAPGTAIARGPVAGTEAGVRRASSEALRRLYEQYYTPERTTLVMVGDFDPAAAESEIQARFSDWRSKAQPEPKQQLAAVRSDRGTEAYLFLDPRAQTTVTIATAGPLGGSDASKARDSSFLEHIGSEILNRRLARLAARPGAPFASANSALYDHFATARVARIEVVARDRDWRSAVQGGAAELRRALDRGFSQAELDEQLALSFAALARDAAPRTSSALADAIADAVGRGIVFTAPGDRSSTADYLARVRLDQVNGAFRAAWSSRNRLIFASHHRPIAGAEKGLLQAWAAARE